MTTRWRWSPRRKCAPAACPTRRAVSAVIGSLLVRPRMPSVPKNFRVIAAGLARSPYPAPDADGQRVQPCRKKEQERSAEECRHARPGDAAPERYEGGLRGPFVKALTHQLPFLGVLPDRPDHREEEDCAVENQRFTSPHHREMDRGPDGEAPHHWVASDCEHALRDLASL